MSELQAEPLSPLDAATLWPQMRRLGTEVVATRTGENLLLSSGLAAIGLTHLPRMPRTAVLGVKRGLGYRGVLISRELQGGAGWEALSLRLAREVDDETLIALIGGTCAEAGRRGARIVYMRFAEGSPHASAIRAAGMIPYASEHLFALPDVSRGTAKTLFRPAERSDRHGIFRLYCRAVPEIIRRNEAPTQQDWRAVLDSYGCEKEWVLDSEASVLAWVGIGGREARVMVYGLAEGAIESALDLVESSAPADASLVLGDYQEDIARRALERGYMQLGTRLICARRIAVLNPLKEGARAGVKETLPLPQ